MSACKHLVASHGACLVPQEDLRKELAEEFGQLFGRVPVSSWKCNYNYIANFTLVSCQSQDRGALEAERQRLQDEARAKCSFTFIYTIDLFRCKVWLNHVSSSTSTINDSLSHCFLGPFLIIHCYALKSKNQETARSILGHRSGSSRGLPKLKLGHVVAVAAIPTCGLSIPSSSVSIGHRGCRWKNREKNSFSKRRTHSRGLFVALLRLLN